jgi:hypothetical protein
MDLHTLALGFDDLSNKVSEIREKVAQENIHENDPEYHAWLAKLEDLDDQFNALQNAATKLDTAYAQLKLAGMDKQIAQITAATNSANATIKTIADINKVFHIVAAVVAAAGAVAATIAAPGVGAPALVSSAQALVAAIKAYNS